MFRQRFSVKVLSNVSPPLTKNRVSYAKPQGVNASESSLPTCFMFINKHEGRCLTGSNACFCCGKMDRKIRIFNQLLRVREMIVHMFNIILNLVLLNITRKIYSLHFRIVVNKRVLLMLLSMCGKSSN